MSTTKVKHRGDFLFNLLSLLIICLLIGVNWVVLGRFFSTNYFLWFTSQGSLISLSVAFVSLIWEDMNVHPLLVSANPRLYLYACFTIIAGVFASLSTIPNSALSPVPDDAPKVSLIRLLWDSVLSIVIILLMTIIGGFWLVMFSPLMYFVMLVTGAPARMGLINPEMKSTLIRTSKSKPSGESSVSNKEGSIKRERFNLSLSDKPVTLALFISGGVLEIVHELKIDLWIVERISSLFT